MTENAPATPGTDRFLVGIVAGAVLLMLLGVVAVVVVGRAPAAATADVGSPVGVVQAYVDAIRAGEIERAYALLSRSAQATTSLQEFGRPFARAFGPSDGASRVLITPATQGADTAEVKITISRFHARAEPFSTNTSHQDVSVRLVHEDGAWRISQPTGAYPFIY